MSVYVMSHCVTSSPVASCHVTPCHCKRRHIISRHTSPCQPHCTFAWRYILHVTLWSNLHGNGYWFSCGLHHLYCPFRLFYISKELKRKGTFLRDLSGNGGRRQRKLSRLKISTRFYYFSLFRYTSWYSLLNRSYLSVILYFIFFKTNSLLLQSRVSQSVHARNIKGNTTRFRSRQDLPNDKVIKGWYEKESQNEIQTQSLKIAAKVLIISLTLYTITSVSIFSILFSKYFLRCWQGEFV